MIALDDTTRCNAQGFCEVCDRRDGAAMRTVNTVCGVACVELCDECIEEDAIPRWSLSFCVSRVLDHCEHLGIDADRMADALAREQQKWETA